MFFKVFEGGMAGSLTLTLKENYLSPWDPEELAISPGSCFRLMWWVVKGALPKYSGNDLWILTEEPRLLPRPPAGSS